MLSTNTVVVANPDKEALGAAITAEWKKSEEEKRQFDFDTIYTMLCRHCQKQNISLEDIRFTLENSPLMKDLTLLHLMIKALNVRAVSILTRVNPIYENQTTISRRVSHPTSNNLLHFCGLWAKNDAQHIMQGNEPFFQPLNAELIEIVKILSDKRAPDYWSLEVEFSILNKYLATPTHSAAIAGAFDLVYFFYCKSKVPAAFFLPQDVDGNGPLDTVSQSMAHFHLLPLALAATYMPISDDYYPYFLNNTMQSNLLWRAQQFFIASLREDKSQNIFNNAQNSNNFNVQLISDMGNTNLSIIPSEQNNQIYQEKLQVLCNFTSQSGQNIFNSIPASVPSCQDTTAIISRLHKASRDNQKSLNSTSKMEEISSISESVLALKPIQKNLRKRSPLELLPLNNTAKVNSGKTEENIQDLSSSNKRLKQ